MSARANTCVCTCVLFLGQVPRPFAGDDRRFAARDGEERVGRAEARPRFPLERAYVDMALYSDGLYSYGPV